MEPEPALPPEDPEQWSDEEWLGWLREGDNEPDDGEPVEGPRAGSRRRGSTGSQLLYAGMFGLHQAIYGDREEVTIVEEAGGEPDDPQSLEVHLDRDRPDESTVIVRPWLLDESAPED